jgi:hypothetical protein
MYFPTLENYPKTSPSFFPAVLYKTTSIYPKLNKQKLERVAVGEEKQGDFEQ